jgi:hypothetical protein
LLTLLYVGMGTILPCLLGVLPLLDGVAVMLALVASSGFGLVWYVCHGAGFLGISLSYVERYEYY